MKDKNKTKDQLMKELAEMRLRIAELEKVEVDCKEAEGKVERLYRQNELILNSAGEGIFGLDRLGKHTFVNSSATRMLGYEVEELIGKHSHQIWHHTRPDGSPYPEQECPIYAAFRDGAVHHVSDEVFWRKNGTSFSAAYTSNPILEDGKLVGAVVTFRDITERKRAEEKIHRLNEELEQHVLQLEAANRELEAFSYSVSHDLRAPVRAVTGFSSMLLNDYSDKLDDEGKRLLDVIRNSTRKMAELIDDLLALSRIGRKDIELSVVEMNTVVTSVLDEIKTTMPERNLQFSIKPLPVARCDAGMIRLVLLNLLYNAIKFTKQRENVIIEIGGRDGKGENVYYVKDNGVGFDMQYASKLFGAFQRLHSGEEFEGTGIGLAIVQRIIYRHGGRVWAEGKVNEGATFYFTLPREPELFLTKSES